MNEQFYIAGRKIVLAAFVCAAALASPAVAGTFDDLKGAWGLQSSSCKQIFKMKNGRMVFAKSAYASEPGFIVNGRKVQGAASNCNVLSEKSKDDVLTFLMECSSQISFDKRAISVRFLDPNTITRFEPDFPEIQTNFVRCDR